MAARAHQALGPAPGTAPEGSSPSLKVQNFFFTGPKLSSLTMAGSSRTFFSTYTIMLFSWKADRHVSPTPLGPCVSCRGKGLHLGCKRCPAVMEAADLEGVC